MVSQSAPVIELETTVVDLRSGEIRPRSLGTDLQCHALDADLLWRQVEDSRRFAHAGRRRQG